MYLEANQVPSHLRAGYTGKKFQAVPQETVTVPRDAGLWSGGTRDTFTVMELATGRVADASDNITSPWNEARQDRLIPLKSGYAVVKHSFFCGNDMGLTFYVHPDDIVKLLPDTAALGLTDIELKFLAVMRGIKSGYRAEYFSRMKLNQTDIDGYKAKFTAMGLLNKAGAITVKGKNACENIRPY